MSSNRTAKRATRTMLKTVGHGGGAARKWETKAGEDEWREF